MHFLCRTDSGVRPLSKLPPATTPFYAHKDTATLSTLISTWEAGLPAFLINPRLPLLPQMPKVSDSYATLLYTSGTTSSPKIACHSFENYTYSAQGSLAPLRLERNDRWLLSLPLFHVGGLAILFRCKEAGAEVVISELPLTEALLAHRITHLSLVPTQLYRLLEEDPRTVERASQSLKVILLGGAPAPPILIARAKSAGLPIHTTYGLTEMTSQVTIDPIPGPLPYREVKIAEDGEIFVKGETLFKGYLNASLKLDDEGWFATRDLGEWTPGGSLKILGRKDNLFISGGENIQPEEIESALLTLPGIFEAIVVPQPDPEFGMRPAAFISSTNEKYTLEDIRERLRDKLPSYKLPIALHSLPQQPPGLKRSRHELSQRLANLAGLLEGAEEGDERLRQRNLCPHLPVH